MFAALAVFSLSLLLIAFARPATGVPVPFQPEKGFILDRPAGAVLGAIGMVVCGVVTPEEATHGAISYDTLILLLGMMVVCAYMIEARVFRFAAYLTLSHVRDARQLLVAVVVVSGVLSAVLVNDTVCLMTTPLVLQCCRDAKLRPLPYLLAVCFGANAGSVATPTGNPQNMIIATLSGVPYAHFVKVLGLPALLSLAVVAGVLLWVFRADLPRGPLPQASLERPAFDPRLAALCGVALVVILAGFLAGYPLSWTAMAGAGLLMLGGQRTPRRLLERVDWVLLLFFAGLFIVVYGAGKAGLAQLLFARLQPVLGTDPLRQAALFGGFTVALSQLVSNVPFVLLSAHWMPLFADAKLMWLSMALFSTLAGNLTIVGSVANLIVLESAGEEGRIGFFAFLRYGAIVTVLTLGVGFAALCAERALGWL